MQAVSYRSAAKIYERSHLGRVTRTTGLSGLTLAVERGEIFGLLGLNGAGKTTALKLLAGLIRPTAGEVLVLGEKAGTMEAKAKIGFLPELPYFDSWLKPAESLYYYGRLSGVSPEILRKKIPELVSKVGLGPHAGKELREFSKGMLQRVGLAQALIHEPELLVLDEPVSGLDPLAVHDFRELLSSLNSAGTTVILSSHSISELEKSCRRVAILKAGTLAAVVGQEEWKAKEGGLEAIFVETVRDEK